MGIADHLTCLLRSLYAGQEATEHCMEQLIGSRLRKENMLLPCLFNLYADSIMRNARLDELQAGIKIGRKNINNLRYADGITLMAESEEELNSILMWVKEKSERAS